MIHPTAIVEAENLPADLEIGPWALVEAGALLGEGCRLAARSFVGAGARLGKNVQVGVGAVVGAAPQDRKYDGGPSTLVVGDGVVIREYATLHTSTSPDEPTRVGAGSWIMAYAHVAHDCQLGEECILSNGVQLAGHVRLGAGCNLGGLSAVHQFCLLGDGVFVAGLSKVDRDVPPYSKAIGNPARWGGFNRLGAERRGLSVEAVHQREEALRTLYRRGLGIEEALRILAEEEKLEEYRAFVAFRRSGLIQLPRR